MSLKKIIFFSLLSALGFSFSPSWSFAQTSANQSRFISVSGKVTLGKGKKSRQAHKNSTVREGDTVATGKNSSATLRFFDGSELKVMADSKFTIAKMAKVSQDKIFNFNLALGKLKAIVAKLTSSKSSFEIEAGGVVCGVRGTEYEVDYDPDQNKVDVFVTSGSVWAQVGGDTFQYGPGNHGRFIQGKPDQDRPGGPGNHGPKDKEKTGGRDHDRPASFGNRFNAFYGMGGNRPDPFQPLTGDKLDTDRLSGKTGDDSLLGLGAHVLILRLKYPEQ